jgi:hypothetical protein
MPILLGANGSENQISGERGHPLSSDSGFWIASPKAKNKWVPRFSGFLFLSFGFGESFYLFGHLI